MYTTGQALYCIILNAWIRLHAKLMEHGDIAKNRPNRAIHTSSQIIR